jgi:hypothetical protein
MIFGGVWKTLLSPTEEQRTEFKSHYPKIFALPYTTLGDSLEYAKDTPE